jgi:glycosyltransferase involved in cell wall biosynthesis
MYNITRVLTLVGDPNDINTWSNTSYFFLKAAKAKGFIHRGLSLQPQKLKRDRVLWNFASLLLRGEKGGYQYSDRFLNQLFRQVSLASDSTIEFISHFPLLPPRPWQTRWIANYYIDATLKQNFDDYGIATKVGSKIRENSLIREQENYHQAKRVICMSHWAAKSVIDDYQVSPDKVHVIPAGANLDESHLPQSHELQNQEIPALEPLKLGFIGKNWQRKGLPFLLEIAEILHERGIAVEVLVIGPKSEDLPAHSLMKPLGFINKHTHLTEFVEAIQQFHFGCLFSTVEAFGISNRECLRLGIPVLGSRAGGIPDTMPEGLGFLFELGTPASAIANFLESFITNPEKYQILRTKAIDRATEVTWKNTIDRFLDIW